MRQNIRLAAIEDHPVVEEIVQSAYAMYIPRIGRKPGPMLDDYTALIRERQVYVIGNDGVIDGLLVLIREEEAMLLDNVAVRPGAQGLGYGRKLLEFAERTALNEGYKSIRLYTHETMTENIALYSRFGFMETHRAEEKGLRRVYMTRLLDEPLTHLAMKSSLMALEKINLSGIRQNPVPDTP